MAETPDRPARLSLAICEYDHVRDLISGPVRVDGLELDVHVLPIAEIFQRFTRTRDWHMSEMSLGMYACLKAQGDDGLTAIPVFTSRMFRLSSFYVRADSRVRTLADLRGARVGYPDWMHTAGIFARGHLMQVEGIRLNEITWVQAGVNHPGLKEILQPSLPSDVHRISMPDRSLDELLVAGEIEAVLSSHPLTSFTRKAGTVRLVPNFVEQETAAFQATGVFPIMHLIALRRDVVDAHPWLPPALQAGFEEAKSRSLERMRDSTISRYPFPWTFTLAEKAEELFGRDFWPYGIEPNRTTLNAFLDMCVEQGVTHRRVGIDELFA